MEQQKKRIRLWVSYDGTSYSGWQIQPNAPTIEGELDRAISKLIKEDIHVIGASRTDAGVHADGNVAVFDTTMRMPAEKYCYALNSFLPDDIVVQASDEVPEDWHPRHCDCEKTYEYRIWRGRFDHPQYNRYTATVHGELDLEKMRLAAKQIEGTHDFTSFCAAASIVEDKTRTVYSVEVLEQPAAAGPKESSLLTIRVRGNGFLYNMVRIIAGTLLEVGKGNIPWDAITGIIEAKDRSKAGPTAPAKGLTLCRIEYM